MLDTTEIQVVTAVNLIETSTVTQSMLNAT